jgi:hypothetical protein
MTTLAQMNLAQYREGYPYGAAAFHDLSTDAAAQEAARLGVRSAQAAAFLADLVDTSMMEDERVLVAQLAAYSGRDLSSVAVDHLFVPSPTAITFYDPNDDSFAIGFDPGMWQVLCFLYLDAALGQRADSPQLFLVFATKTVGWFWVGAGKATAAQDIDFTIEFTRAAAPDFWSFAKDVVETSISFTIAHEVGHIVLDHLTGPHAHELRLGPHLDKRGVVSAMDSYEAEHDADAWAAEALLALAKDDFKKQTLAVSVPALSFALLAVASAMHEPASEELARLIGDMHPPDAERARRLARLAATHATDVAPSNAMKHLVGLGAWVSEQRRFLETEGMGWMEQWLKSNGASG